MILSIECLTTFEALMFLIGYCVSSILAVGLIFLTGFTIAYWIRWVYVEARYWITGSDGDSGRGMCA